MSSSNTTVVSYNEKGFLRGVLDASVSNTKSLIKNRVLLFQLSKRELSEPYAGQLLGSLWTFIHPIFLMLVYLFIFGVVFKQRIGGTRELPLDFTTYILSGFVPWLTFQMNLAKSCGVITGHASLVKQVVFPIEILPVKSILATSLNQIVSVVILISYVLFCYKSLPVTYLILPILIFLQLIFSIGIGYILSAISVFVKDTKDLVSLFCVASIYLLPIVYLPEWVPKIFQPFVYLNPFSYMIWCYQDVLYFGRIEHPAAWMIFVPMAIMSYGLGAYFFKKMQYLFGDVLQ
jgi:lipopolysaccharide transport system permease protein